MSDRVPISFKSMVCIVKVKANKSVSSILAKTSRTLYHNGVRHVETLEVGVVIRYKSDKHGWLR
jgi:hypothetical protein